ncbi:MAG TPA: hypothetical protein VE959_07830 [Bryobacteraceae bacterium]|nr:hypothetical protein [Bryobacteraceae bacterium]
MKRLLFAVMLLAAPAVAQQASTPAPEPRVQKLFILKYANPQTVRNLLVTFGATAETNQEMRALAVSATANQMPAIEDAIARLDVPSAAPKNIDLTCYMVIGGESDAGLGGPMPKELDSVVTQLKSAFAFKNYRLMDVLILRARTGQTAQTTSSGGTVASGSGGSPLVQSGNLQVVTTFQIKSASIGTDGTTIRIDGMRASSRVPLASGNGQFNYTNLGLDSDVDIKEGQKVVVGRVGVTNDQALFLVLLAKVLN